MAEKLLVLSLGLITICTTTGSDTCHAINDGICSKSYSEADISAVDDVHAMEVRVSFLQKQIAHMQRHSHISKLSKVPTQDGGRFPLDHVQCAGELAKTTTHMTFADYDAVVTRMRQIYHSQSPVCGAEHCEQSHWAGCILRLAAHDFMDYFTHDFGGSQVGLGGSDGCLDFQDVDNAGLDHCFIGGPTVTGLAKAYEDFCTKISLADFLVIAAEGVMNITRENVLKVDPHRKALDFRSKFKYGRISQGDCSYSLGLMPDAERGCAAVQDTLMTNLGFTWDQSAALMGGHTLGGALASNSGYKGRWKEASASRLFDNGYYTSLVLKGWSPDTNVAGNAGKNQWKRADIGVDEHTKGYEMMLDSDMCLYHSFYYHHSDNLDFHASTAHQQGCDCAWARPSKFSDAIKKYTSGEVCGSTEVFDLGPELHAVDTAPPEDAPGTNRMAGAVVELPGDANGWNMTQRPHIETVKQRVLCCGMGFVEGASMGVSSDCGEAGAPKGPAAAAVMLFANDEDAWIAAYYEAWELATTKGREQSLSLLVH